MSEEDLEVLITLDDPGEDELEEDSFHLKDKVSGPGRRPRTQETELIVDIDDS